MDRKEKLLIAKLAYAEIQEALKKYKPDGKNIFICPHWDECITVDGELFHGHELREGI